MGGSSLRNCVQRRNHKERGQLHHRRNKGILEKKSDYKLRAKDYHKKQDALKLLRKKAALRNPDEYYMAMNNSKTVNGVHRSLLAERNSMMDQETVTALKTQDSRYISVKRTANARKLEQLKNHMHIVPKEMIKNPNESQSKHTIFVDTDEELKKFNASEYFDTPEQLLNRTHNRPNTKSIETMMNMESERLEKIKKSGSKKESSLNDRKLRNDIEKAKQKTLTEIINRQEREDKLKKLEQELNIQRSLMGKGSRRKVGTDKSTGLAIWKWKTERKR